MTTAILLEFAEDVRELARSEELSKPVVQIISLAPEATVELERLGVPFIRTDHLLATRNIQDQLDVGWAKLEKFTSTVPYGATVAYYLKVLLDTSMEKILQLCTMLERIRPERVIAFSPSVRPFDFRMVFHERESVYSHVLPLVIDAVASNTRLELREARRVDAPAAPRKKRIAVRFLRRILRSVQAVRERMRWKDQSILLVEEAYGLRTAVGQIRNDYAIIRWHPTADSPRNDGHRLTEQWQSLKQDPAFRAIFTFREVDFFPIVEPRLARLFSEVFPAVEAIESSARTLIRERNVRCVASAFFSSPYTYAIALAARAEKIPVITMQHSSYGYWLWRIAKYTDAVMSDYKLVGGQGVVRYVEEVEKAGCKPVPTGLAMLDPLLVVAPPSRTTRRRRVVYPLASYAKNYIPYSNSRLTLGEYFEVNRAILSVLGKHPEYDVIVYPHPAPSFRANAQALERWSERQQWPHVSFDWNGDTVKAMQAADLIVIDSPSSVMLQATTTRRKIMLYNGIFPMTVEGVAALRKRTVYHDQLDTFVEELDRTLTARDVDIARLDNEEFVRAYGTYLHDGRSLERATEALRSIAQQGMVR